MPITLDSLAEQAMTLRPEQREALIARLQDSSAPQVDLHPDWDAEIARRIAALDAGHVQLIDAQQALTRLGEHLRIRPRT